MKLGSTTIDEKLYKVIIEVPYDEYSPLERGIYNKARNMFNVPGFRKGRAPLQLIKARYGNDIFYEDLADEIVDIGMGRYFKDYPLQTPAEDSEINITNIEEDEEKNLIIELEFTSQLDFKLDEEPIFFEEEDFDFDISDEEIEKELEIQKEEFTDFETVTDIKNGDTVVFDKRVYKINDDHTEIHESKYDQKVILDEGYEEYENLAELIEEEIPEILTLETEDDSGETVITEYIIKSVKRPVYFEIDDDFAKHVLPERMTGEMDLEGYKEFIRDILKNEKINYLRNALIQKILNHILVNSVYDIPDELLEIYSDSMDKEDELKANFYLNSNSYKYNHPEIKEETLDVKDDLKYLKDYLKYRTVMDRLYKRIDKESSDLQEGHYRNMLVGLAKFKQKADAQEDLAYDLAGEAGTEAMNSDLRDSLVLETLLSNALDLYGSAESGLTLDEILD